MKKCSNQFVWFVVLILSIYELLQFQFTGCAHTFRGAIVCDFSAAAGYVLIGSASIVGMLIGICKKKK